MTATVNAREWRDACAKLYQVLGLDPRNFRGTIAIQCAPDKQPIPDVRHFPEVVDETEETGVR